MNKAKTMMAWAATPILLILKPPFLMLSFIQQYAVLLTMKKTFRPRHLYLSQPISKPTYLETRIIFY